MTFAVNISSLDFLDFFKKKTKNNPLVSQTTTALKRKQIKRDKAIQNKQITLFYVKNCTGASPYSN